MNEKLAPETVDIVTAHATKKVDSIQKSIPVNQRYLFVKELFEGFEHYRIPVGIEYNEDYGDHLNQKEIHQLMEELSLIISQKEYFREKSVNY